MTEKTAIKTAVVFWLITIAYMAAIFYLSSRSWHNIPSFVGKYDKVVHICIYMPLAFLVYLAINKSGLKKYGLIIAFLFGAIYGVTDEIHQMFVKGRVASLGDVWADSFGALVGSLWASFIQPKI